MSFTSSYPSLAQAQAFGDVAPSWMWTIDIYPPSSGGVPAISNLRVMNVSLPFSYINSKDVFRAASNIYFPHFNNIENISIGFLETEDLFLLQAIQTWQSLIVDSNGNYGLPINYMGNIVLTLRDNAGNSRGTCTLYGIWPSKLDPWQLTYENANHLAVQVEFSTNQSQFVFNGSNVLNLGNNNANGGILV